MFIGEKAILQANSNETWILKNKLVYKTDLNFTHRKDQFGLKVFGLEITVIDGFKTDLASTPRFLWPLFPPYDSDYLESSILHDALYASQVFTRYESDRLFLEAMKRSGASWLKRSLVFRGVRCGGWVAWREHSKRILLENRSFLQVDFF